MTWERLRFCFERKARKRMIMMVQGWLQRHGWERLWPTFDSGSPWGTALKRHEKQAGVQGSATSGPRITGGL